MRKIIRNFVSWMLILVTVFAVTGCATNGNTNDAGNKGQEKEKTIVGTWECEIDMTQYFHESFVESAGEDVGKFFEFNNLTVVMVLDIDQNSKIVGSYDEKAIDKFTTILLEDMKTGMQKYMEATLEGTGVTVEDALKQSNTTIDKMVEESFELEDLKKEMKETFLEAEYQIKDDKMYILLDDEDKEESYLVYEFEKDTFTIKQAVGMDDTDFEDMTFPLEFKRK